MRSIRSRDIKRFINLSNVTPFAYPVYRYPSPTPYIVILDSFWVVYFSGKKHGEAHSAKPYRMSYGVSINQ